MENSLKIIVKQNGENQSTKKIQKYHTKYHKIVIYRIWYERYGL